MTRSNLRPLLFAFGLAAALLQGCGGDWPSLSSLPLDLDGRPFHPFAKSDARASAFLFVHTACPVSNRLAPEVARIQAAYASQRVAFWLVYPDPSDTPELIRSHVAEYGYGAAGILRDPEHALVAATGVTRTPEVAVYDARGRRVYRGRVNDRFVEFGKTRPAPTRNDLDDALAAAIDGRAPVEAETEAIGCYIADLR